MDGVITAIQAGNNPRMHRANIFIDGQLAFSLAAEVVLKRGLKVGQALSDREIERLTVSDRSAGCLNAALHFLSYRPRSEAETRARLQKHGYANTEIDEVIEHLRQSRLLDDGAFAEYWKENRNAFQPRSQRVLKMELRRKGLSNEVINETIEDVDEAENAYRAATAKARTLPAVDYDVFRQKLGGYLQRRGFSYETIKKTLKRLWEEKTGAGHKIRDVELD
jgi:regulatory protein